MSRPTRRSVLAGLAALAVGPGIARGRVGRQQLPELPLRELGRTGRKLPCLGLGCAPLANLPSREEGVAVVRRALESGARYIDTAPSYTDGESERRVGLAIRGWPREELFIATKTLHRDGDGALAELEQSLERLGCDYVDCLQVHQVHEDVESVFAKDGVLAALQSAREKKKLRHIGMTCHRDPAFALAALERFDFDTALVPVNPLDTLQRSFVKEFLPKARAKRVAVIAMKVFCGGALLHAKPEIPAGELVRWALAQDGVAVAVPGADSLEHWDELRKAACQPPLDPQEQAALVQRCGPHQGKQSEWYKDP